MALHRPHRSISRREFLRYGALGAGVVALGPLGRFLPAANGAPQKLTRMVVVNCYGGNDTLNMVAPISLTPYHERRPGLDLTSSTGLTMDVGPRPTSDYVLHPSMPKIASLWADGDVAVVQKTGYEEANLSHFVSQDIFSLGVRGSFGDLHLPRSGWIARLADLYAPTPMGAVSVGVGRPLDFVGGTSNPLLVKSLSRFKIKSPSREEIHLHRLDKVKRVLDRFAGGGASGEAKQALGQAHDLADQIQTAVTSYSSSVEYTTKTPATSLQDIARLIQGGFETRVFFCGFGGFDTHGDQGAGTGRHGDLLQRLDDGIGAFADDMKAMGEWNRMVVIILTEFGRRNFKNGSSGTDHGHGFAEVLVGGAVKGGSYGPDLVEDDLNENYLDYEVDFRQIYKEVLDGHLGVDPSPVFPEALVKDGTLGLV